MMWLQFKIIGMFGLTPTAPHHASGAAVDSSARRGVASGRAYQTAPITCGKLFNGTVERRVKSSNRKPT
jgi:hypothetical protein